MRPAGSQEGNHDLRDAKCAVCSVGEGDSGMTDKAESTASNAPERGASSKPLSPVSFRYITLLTLFTVGTSAVFHLNQQVIGLSVRRFTQDMFVVGIILALPGIIRCIVTPYAAWKSDRIWTRFGRRKPFVIFMAPILVAALLWIPQCNTLWAFVLVLVLLQIAEDAEMAIMMPSIGDSVPDKQRPLAMGMWQFAIALSGILMAMYGIRMMKPGLHRVTFPLVERLHVHAPHITLQGGDHWPYTVSAVLVAIASLLYLVVMKERYVAPRPQERFRLFKYSKEMFRLREHRLIWVISFFQPLFFGVSMGFMSTLGKVGMGLDASEYSAAYWWFPFVQMLLAAPLGWLFNAYRYRKAFCIAACFYVMIPATFGIFFMKNEMDMAIFFGSLVIAFMAFRTNFTPYLMEYTTPKNVGTILGFSSLVGAAGSSSMFALIGWMIRAMHNYRIPLYGLYLSAVVCMIALMMMRAPEQVKHLVEEADSEPELRPAPAEA